MSFEQLNLNPQINKALLACGYTKPTPIQSKSIPEILLGKDMVATAQTGTGKTAAFVLPALHHLATLQGKDRDDRPRVLILTPTRELATQITEAVGKYGKFLRCNTVSLVGGMPYRQQLRSLSRPMDIVVATPGRLMDHMGRGRLDLSQIDMLILDEADRMLDMGFIDDVKNIASSMPAKRQTLLFSATVDDRLTSIIRQFLKNPVRIQIETEKMAPAKIAQSLYLADHSQHKMKILMHLVKELGVFKGIIFSGTKINADRLADELYEEGIAAAALHGDLKQNVRNRTLDQLRRGKIQFLVATDVAARGIDVQDITHVINFDLPKFSEDYVHRIGRTGRAGKEGIAISLALPSDLRHVQRIERLLKQQIERKMIPGLEPKKSADRPAHKDKKAFGKKSFGKKEFGKKKFAKKEFGKKTFARDQKRDDFAPRKPKKEFGSKPFNRERDDFAPRKPKKEFGSKPFSRERNDFAPRKPKKEFGTKPFSRERDDFAPRRPKKEFGKKPFSRERDDFAPRRPKKEFGSKPFSRERNDFAPRKPKKEFGEKPFSRERDKFPSRKPKSFATTERFEGPKKKRARPKNG